MRAQTAGTTRAVGWIILLWASASAVAAQTATPSPPGRFTISRTLADGRVEIRSVTVDELRAMSRPAPPRPVAPMLPGTVVFALPAPIPDPVRTAQARAAIAAFAIPTAPAPPPAAITSAAADDVSVRRTTPQAPSAAAIRVATANRTSGALHSALLSGGWTLLNRDDAAHSVDDEAEIDGPVRIGAPPVSKKRKGDKTPLGVRDGKSYGEQGRFYLYAGVKNRGVGLNLTDHNGEASGGWGSDGVSYDRGGFAGQRSAGLGWRQGDVSTSLGWVHEKNNIKGMYGAPAEKDDRVAVTFSWRPSTRSTTARRGEP